jgi:hypothetical protein
LRRRNRPGLNKLWMLALALLVALGAMGIAYGAWTDEIYIQNTVQTGSISAELACIQGGCWVEGTPAGDTSVSCGSPTVDPLTLTIKVKNAQYDPAPQLNTHYYCNFIISNAASSLPIKIQSVTLTPEETYTNVSASVEDLPEDPLIDPGDTATAKVHIYLTGVESVEKNLVYTLEVTIQRWNE